MLTKAQIDENEKKIFLRFFEENVEKRRKKWKMMKRGHLLLRKVEIDEKWKNIFFSNFSEKDMKMSKKVKNDEKGSDIEERGKS